MRRSGSIPNRTKALSIEGNAYSDKGDNDRAIADYNEAIRPRSQRRHGLLPSRVAAYSDKGDKDRAIADYDAAIRLDSQICHRLRPVELSPTANKGDPRPRPPPTMMRRSGLNSEILPGLLCPRAVHICLRAHSKRALADFNQASAVGTGKMPIRRCGSISWGRRNNLPRPSGRKPVPVST